MPLTTDKIPNKALNGREVLEIAVQEFRAMLERDCMFLKTVAYRRVGITFTAVFDFGNPHPVHEVRSRVKAAGVVEGEAPLTPEPEEGELRALERKVELENPNLERVHHDLPIKVQGPPRPAQVIVPDNTIPGEPPAEILQVPVVETKELRYDKTQYPEPKAAVDTDVSEREAKRLGRPVKKGFGWNPRPEVRPEVKAEVKE